MVTDAFNSMLKGIMFQRLFDASGDIIQLIPFVCTLYAFESPPFIATKTTKMVSLQSHCP
jgi:hypothetical protein